MKALILSIDAMFSDQAARLRQRPALAPLFRNCLSALDMRPIYPALTYPCHVSIVSGNSPRLHGVYHNLDCAPGARYQDWKWYYTEVQCPTLFDGFRQAGWTTAAVFWPVTAQAPVDYLVPEIWSYTDDPVNAIRAANNGRVNAIIDRHREDVDFTSKFKLDRFAKDCAKEIITEYDPDVLFLHLSLVDNTRHGYGCHHEKVEEAFDQCAAWLEELLACVPTPLEALTLVVLGDHGHLDCQGSISVNRLFAEKGWLTVPGKLSECAVFSHSAGVSAQVYVNNKALTSQVEALFDQLKGEGYLLGWYPKAETLQWGLDGPFDYVLEGGDGYFFTDAVTATFFTEKRAKDGGPVVGKHGHCPLRGERPPFLVCGPGIKSAELRDRSILDIAPTLCRLFGLPEWPMEGSSMLEACAQ